MKNYIEVMSRHTALYVFLFVLCSTFGFSASFTSVQTGPWSDGATWGNLGSTAGVDYPDVDDAVIIANTHTLTYSGDLTMGVANGDDGNITVNSGGTLTVTGNFLIENGSKSILTNNGIININGNLTQEQGDSSDDIYIYNYGDIFITGGSYSNAQNTTLQNDGLLSITNGNFTTIASAFFEHNGTLIIDNVGYTFQTVTFNNLNHTTDIELNTGSEIFIYNSDLSIINGSNDLNLYGIIHIEDGDLIESMNINVESGGGIYLEDTDNSGDDGKLIMNNGGQTVVNDGDIFAETIELGGGDVTITDNHIVFIKNLSAANFDAGANELNVSATGLLYYCDNPDRSGKDPLGTVSSGGQLYYSQDAGGYPLGYKVDSFPNADASHVDFTVDNADQYDIATLGYSSCENAYTHRLEEQLPIQLSFFVAEYNSNGTLISWQTVSEDNNDYFTLYRSFDGINFEKIARVQGAGNSNSIRNYDYTDADKNPGLVYYKLAQTDYDGTTTYSKIVVVSKSNNSNDCEFIISQNNIDVLFAHPYETNHIVITSLDGSIVYSKQFKDVEMVSISNNFARGVYVITNYTQSFITSQKFKN